MIKAIIFDFNGVIERNSEIDAELIDYIADELGGYKTAVFTAMEQRFLKVMLHAKNPFDELFTIDNIEFRKPSKLAFAEVAKALELQPEECLMIDDSPLNTAGAEAAGMQAMLYSSFKDFKIHLSSLFKIGD